MNKKVKIGLVALASLVFAASAYAEFGLGVGSPLWNHKQAATGCVTISAADSKCKLFPAGNTGQYVNVFVSTSGVGDIVFVGDNAATIGTTGNVATGGDNGTGAGSGIGFPSVWSVSPNARELYAASTPGMGSGFCTTPYTGEGTTLYMPCQSSAQCSTYDTLGTCDAPTDRAYNNAGLFAVTNGGNVHAFVEKVR